MHNSELLDKQINTVEKLDKDELMKGNKKRHANNYTHSLRINI